MPKNRKRRRSDDVGFVILRVVFAFFVIVTIILSQKFLQRETEEVELSDILYTGTFIWFHDGTYDMIDLPTKLDVKPGEPLIVETILPRVVMISDTLCFNSAHETVRFYIKNTIDYAKEDVWGTKIYEYDTTDTWYGGNNSASGYVFVPMKAGYSGRVLRIEIISDSAYSGTLRELYYGDKAAMWTYIFKVMSSSFTVAAILLVAGGVLILGCVLIAIVITGRRISVNYLGWCAFSAGLWIMCESKYRQIIFSNYSFLAVVAFFVLFMYPASMIFYFNCIQDYRYDSFYKTLFCILAGTTIVCTVLHLTKTYDFVQTQYINYGAGYLTMLAILGILIYELIKKKLSDYKYAVFGYGFVMLGAVTEIVQDVIGANRNTGKFLGMGLFMFVLLAAFNTAKVLLRNEEDNRKKIAEGEAKSQFLANMSHEIRTPLNAVLGMNQMILRDSKDAEITGYAQNIENSGNMLLSLINDILDFSKISAGKMTIVPTSYSLSKAINDLNNTLRQKAEAKKLEFNLHVDPELPEHLYGDEIRVRQIAINIINNAIKYTDVGSIDVSFDRARTADDRFAIKFTVKDTGKGIKEEDKAHLFKAFERVDEVNNMKIEGTGLGLSITASLVSLMGGTIEVNSEYGEGSEFVVIIPQKRDDAEPIGDFKARINTGNEERKRYNASFKAPDAKILVVDDTKTNLTIIKLLLRETEIKVSLADSGPAALEQLKNNQFDLVLLDHMMPDMDGVETLKHINEMYPDRKFPVIALTANAVSGAKEQYLSLGFNDYLSKPVDSALLENLIKKWLT